MCRHAAQRSSPGLAASPGCYGWDGGFGPTFVVDPRDELVAVLMVQGLMGGPNDDVIKRDFLNLAYSAIDT